MTRSSKQILRENTAAAGISSGGEFPVWIVVALMGGVILFGLHSGFRCSCGAIGSVAGAIGLLFAITLPFIIGGSVHHSRLRRVAAGREGETICRFARSFDRHCTDTLVIRAVYERLGIWLGHPGFPVEADDRYYDDLRMSGDDFDDMVDELAELTARPLANMESNPYYGKVQTPRDLVEFFMLQPVSA